MIIDHTTMTGIERIRTLGLYNQSETSRIANTTIRKLIFRVKYGFLPERTTRFGKKLYYTKKEVLAIKDYMKNEFVLSDAVRELLPVNQHLTSTQFYKKICKKCPKQEIDRRIFNACWTRVRNAELK